MASAVGGVLLVGLPVLMTAGTHRGPSTRVQPAEGISLGVEALGRDRGAEGSEPPSTRPSPGPSAGPSTGPGGAAAVLAGSVSGVSRDGANAPAAGGTAGQAAPGRGADGAPSGTAGPGSPAGGGAAQPAPAAGAGTATGTAGATGAPAAPPPPAPAPPASATPTTAAPAPAGRTVVSYASSLCISSGSGKDGQRLYVAACSSSSAPELWEMRPDGTIRSMGLCMDAAWAGTANGTAVQVARCNGGPAQHFVLKGSYDLVSVNADRCVSLVGGSTTPGTVLELQDCNGMSYQKWHAS
ncbi:ricin-type beta-trefoil lectin domain protein [Streptomyces sp. NPDC001380]|uniref:ricin-type beta-trefoil lectin domain protein n=1 Tax=Streptomyces sp. NPDC001380 TaxID=3364566 RepID=UPI0036B6C7B0